MPRVARIATIVLLALVPAAGAATKKHVDTVTATVHKTGRSGTALGYKGIVHSKVFGRGRIVEKVYGDLKGTFVITYKRGKVRGKTVAHAKSGSGGKLTVFGTYKLTSGTGRYKHISGHGSFTGTSTKDLSGATFRQHGPVRF